jgi:hypothetical protein
MSIQTSIYAQSQGSDLRFVAYGALPTWTGVASEWQSAQPKLYFYDPKAYTGHADFVSRGLKQGITFQQFKDLTQYAAKRRFMPFFVYDLHEKPITVAGKAYQWALRIEDYAYDDAPDKMVQQVLRLAKLIPTSLKGLPAQGLIVLSLQDSNPINTKRLAKLLEAKGWTHTTTDELIKHFGGKKIQVLNSGQAAGTLVWVRNEADLAQLTPKHIAVFEYMPRRIPPVAGIITLQPQTMLSHLNLLAKNRGTFNMYIADLNLLPELQGSAGKMVVIDDKNGQVGLRQITEKEAETFWAKNKLPLVAVPTPLAELDQVIPLTADFKKQQTVAHIGAKAANYALLLQLLGEPHVRIGFALGFKPYFQVTQQSSVATLITNFLAEKKQLLPAQRQEWLGQIRTAIKKAKVSEETLESVRKVCDKYYANKRIRFRSSTNAEDLPQFNGAGLYNSEGFNTQDNDQKMEKQILDVFASLWNEEAFLEREAFGIDHQKVGMAVLITEAFVSEAANGVVLVMPDGDAVPSILVNAQPDDNEVANPKAGTVPESFLMHTTNAEVGKIHSQSSISAVFAGNPLFQPLLKNLRENSLKVHKQLVEKQKATGDKNIYSTDIEFEVMYEKGTPKLYFKQARLLRTGVIPK